MVTSVVPTISVNKNRIKTIASTVCQRLGLLQADLSIHFVGTRKMRTLNREYRGKDKSTDVLSFSQVFFQNPLLPVAAAQRGKVSNNKLGRSSQRSQPAPSALLLGDVVISVTDAKKNAKKAGHPTEKEICLLLVHGILHLCGHDHETLTDEKKMFHLQDQFMELLRRDKQSLTSAPAWRNLVRMKGKI